jgi:hypothetical protein
MINRRKTSWEGYSLSRVVWYSHPDQYDHTTTRRLKFDRALEVVDDRGGVKLPPPKRTLTGFTAQQSGTLLETGRESDIGALSWHKSVGEPCGVLSVTLKPRSDYGNKIKPGDVLFAYLTGDKHSSEKLLSVLSVDTVGKTRTVDAAGATVISVQLHCRDIGGKALMDTPTIYDANAAPIYAGEFHLALSSAFTDPAVAGGPSLLVQTMISAFYNLDKRFVSKLGGGDPRELKPFRFPGFDAESLINLVDTNTFIQAPMVGALFHNPSVLMSANNLWALCDMYSNRIVNEMFIDVRDVNMHGTHASDHASEFAQAVLARNGEGGDEQRAAIRELAASRSGLSLDALRSGENSSTNQADQRAALRMGKVENSVMAMVHRQLPFDTVSFYLLPTNVVMETEVFEYNVNRSEREVFNTFRIGLPGGTGQAPYVDELVQDMAYGLTINRDSIMKHGIKRYDGQSLYHMASANSSKPKVDRRKGENEFDEMYHYYLAMVTTWYAYNELLWSGTISMRLRPDIRVGTRLSFYYNEHGHEEIMDFYIQSVEHTFTPEPGSGRTTLGIIRGVSRSSDGPETRLLWNDKGRTFGDEDPFESIVPAQAGFPSKTSDTGAAR